MGRSVGVGSFVFGRTVSFGFASAASLVAPRVRVAARRLGAAASFVAVERVRRGFGAGTSTSAPSASSEGSLCAAASAVAAVLPRPRPPRRRRRLVLVAPSAAGSSAVSAAASDGAARSAGCWSTPVSDRTSASADASAPSVSGRARPLPPRPRPPRRRRRPAPVVADAPSGPPASSIVAGIRSVSPGWLSRSTSGSSVPAAGVGPSGRAERVPADEPPRPPRPRPPRERRRRVVVPAPSRVPLVAPVVSLDAPIVSLVAPVVPDAKSGSGDSLTPIRSGGASVMLTPFGSMEEARASREGRPAHRCGSGELREHASDRRRMSRCAGVRRRCRRRAPAALHCARGKPCPRRANRPRPSGTSPRGRRGRRPRLLEPRRACPRPRWPRARRENLLDRIATVGCRAGIGHELEGCNPVPRRRDAWY